VRGGIGAIRGDLIYNKGADAEKAEIRILVIEQINGVSGISDGWCVAEADVGCRCSGD
jgi:hypothetical protein